MKTPRISTIIQNKQYYFNYTGAIAVLDTNLHDREAIRLHDHADNFSKLAERINSTTSPSDTI
jgi:hypothetical protein